MKWSFSHPEFYLLGGLLQISTLLGLEDLYSDLPIGELHQIMETARQSLSERGQLEQTEDGFLLDGDLLKAIQAIGTSEKVIIAAQDGETRLYHLGVDCLAVQETLPDGRIQISILEGMGAIKQDVMSRYKFTQPQAAPGHDFSVASKVFADIQAMLNDNQPAPARENFLVKNGIPDDEARVWLKSLQQEHGRGSLMIVRRNKDELSKLLELNWLSGNLGSWFIETIHGENGGTLHWEPSTEQEIREKVDSGFGGIVYP